MPTIAPKRTDTVKANQSFHPFFIPIVKHFLTWVCSSLFPHPLIKLHRPADFIHVVSLQIRFTDDGLNFPTVSWPVVIPTLSCPPSSALQDLTDADHLSVPVKEDKLHAR